VDDGGTAVAEVTVSEVRVRGYSGLGFGAKIIRWFTFGEYSHVSFLFRFSDGSSEEIEAIQGGGVHSVEPRMDFDVSLIVPVGKEAATAIYKRAKAMSEAGLKYDWTGIWGFFRRAKRHNPNKWFCSEFIAWVCKQEGYPLSRREPYREAPSAIMETYRLVERHAFSPTHGDTQQIVIEQ